MTKQERAIERLEEVNAGWDELKWQREQDELQEQLDEQVSDLTGALNLASKSADNIRKLQRKWDCAYEEELNAAQRKTLRKLDQLQTKASKLAEVLGYMS